MCKTMQNDATGTQDGSANEPSSVCFFSESLHSVPPLSPCQKRAYQERLLWISAILDSLKGETFSGKHRRHPRPTMAKDIQADS